MNIPTKRLPSGGYGYEFPSVSVSPMTFIGITKYLENLPEDKLDKYLYEIESLLDEDKKILDCYMMDVDFLIFLRKFLTVSGDTAFKIDLTCPYCGEKITKTIQLDQDIHFKQIDTTVMEGSFIELGGHKYETIVPTVKDFFKVFEKYLKYRKIEDLEIIKVISLIKDFEFKGNQIEADVLGAKHNDITLIMALKELYTNRVEPIEVVCPKCKDEETGERRSFTVGVETLAVDFFRELSINCPLDGSKILFKQIRKS